MELNYTGLAQNGIKLYWTGTNFLCSISCRLLRAGLVENKDLCSLEINDIHRHTFPVISLLCELCV